MPSGSPFAFRATARIGCAPIYRPTIDLPRTRRNGDRLSVSINRREPYHAMHPPFRLKTRSNPWVLRIIAAIPELRPLGHMAMISPSFGSRSRFRVRSPGGMCNESSAWLACQSDGDRKSISTTPSRCRAWASRAERLPPLGPPRKMCQIRENISSVLSRISMHGLATMLSRLPRESRVSGRNREAVTFPCGHSAPQVGCAFEPGITQD